METSPKTLIDQFLQQQHIALAGYSHKPGKFGHQVYQTLKKKGYVIHPVNPKGGSTPDGEEVYRDIQSLPDNINALLVMTRPEVTPLVVEEAMGKGISHLWIQQMSGSKMLKEKLLSLKQEVVYNRCILLHANPTGIHKFHRRILGLFGRLPSA